MLVLLVEFEQMIGNITRIKFVFSFSGEKCRSRRKPTACLRGDVNCHIWQFILLSGHLWTEKFIRDIHYVAAFTLIPASKRIQNSQLRSTASNNEQVSSYFETLSKNLSISGHGVKNSPPCCRCLSGKTFSIRVFNFRRAVSHRAEFCSGCVTT
jgi:hypothetical protein